MRRWFVRVALAGVFATLALAVAVVAFGAWLRTPDGGAWLLGQLLGLADPPKGDLVVGSLETDLFSGATLRDVSLRDETGRELLAADSVSATWRLGGLPGKLVRVPTVRVAGLRGDVAVTDAGLDLAALWDTGAPAEPSGPWTGLGIDLIVDDLLVEAPHLGVTVGAERYALDDARLAGALSIRGRKVAVTGLSLDAARAAPDLGPIALRGDAWWDGRNAGVEGLTLRAGPQSLAASATLGRLDGDAPIVGLRVSALHLEPDAQPWDIPVNGPLDGTLSVDGLVAAPAIVLDAATPGGRVNVVGAVDLRPARPTWSATLQTEDLVVDAVLPDVPADTRVHGIVGVTGMGFGWPDDLDATVTLDAGADTVAGQGPMHATGRVALSKGVATVADLVVDVPGGRVTLDGEVDVTGARATARVGSARVDLAELAQWGVPGLVGEVVFRGVVEAGWGEETTASAVGDIVGGGVGYGDDVTVTTVAGPVTATWGPGGGTLVASLDLGRLIAGANTVASARLDLDARASPAGDLAAAGTLTANELLAEPAALASVEALYDVTLGADGAMGGQIGFTTGAVRADVVTGDRAVGTVTLAGKVVGLDATLSDGGRKVIDAEVAWDLDRSALSGTRLLFAPTVARAWTADRPFTARVVPGGVDDVAVALSSGDARVEVRGGWRPDAVGALSATVERFPLDWLAELRPEEFAGWSGVADARLAVEGDPNRPVLLAEAAVTRLVVPGALRGLDARLVAEGEGEELRVTGELGPADAAFARIGGTLPVRLDPTSPALLTGDPLDVSLLLLPGSLRRLAAPLDGVDLPPWRASGELRVTGTLLDPDVAVIGNAEVPAGEEGDHLRIELDAEVVGDRLRTHVLVRERMERRAEVVGGADVQLAAVARGILGEGPEVDVGNPAAWVGDLDVRVLPLQLPVEVLAAFAGVDGDLRGFLTGGLLVQGPVGAPRVQGGLQLTEGCIGGLLVPRSLFAVVPGEGGYAVDADFGFAEPPGGPRPCRGGVVGAVVEETGGLRVSGFVPFDPDLDVALDDQLRLPGLALQVGGAGLPLAVVAAVLPDVRDAGGLLTVEGAVAGSLADPRPDLLVRLRDGRFALGATGVTYEDLTFDLSIDEKAARLDNLLVHTVVGEGPAAKGTVTGELTVKRAGNVDGQLVFDKTWLLNRPDEVLRLRGGDLTFDGKLDALRVRGVVVVSEGRLELGERFFWEASDLQLPPDVVVHRAGGADAAVVSAAVDEGLPIPEWLRLSLQVKLERNAHLVATMPMEDLLGEGLAAFTNLGVDTQLDGDLVIGATDGELSLVGEVLPVRGQATLFGRTFDVREGTIAFTGLDYERPVLDVRAVYDAGQYGEVEAHITGTPDAPGLTLTAADYPSPDDALAIVITGMPASELGGSESSQGQLVGQLLQSLAFSTAKEAGSAIQLDLFEIESGGWRAGKRIGSRVFVVIERDWDADDREDSAYTVTVEAQLGVLGDARAVFEAGSAGESAASIRWRRRF